MDLDKVKAMLRSFATTAIAVLAILAFAASQAPGGVDIPGEFVAWATFLAGLLRTILAYVDPGQPLYGVGSGDTEG